MPWQECCKMDERLRFVARLLDGGAVQGVRCLSQNRLTVNALSTTGVSLRQSSLPTTERLPIVSVPQAMQSDHRDSVPPFADCFESRPR